MFCTGLVAVNTPHPILPATPGAVSSPVVKLRKLAGTYLAQGHTDLGYEPGLPDCKGPAVHCSGYPWVTFLWTGGSSPTHCPHVDLLVREELPHVGPHSCWAPEKAGITFQGAFSDKTLRRWTHHILWDMPPQYPKAHIILLSVSRLSCYCLGPHSPEDENSRAVAQLASFHTGSFL